MDIEEKLAKFREQKLSEEKPSDQNKQTFSNKSILKFFFSSNNDQVSVTKHAESDKIIKRRPLIKPKNKPSVLINEIEETTEPEPEEIKLNRFKLALKFLLWAILLTLFIKLEFGLVYFVCSLLVLIYLNTNVGKKSKISAYSVFNPNVERIQGTITAEQLEKNLIKPF
ncbi:SAY domain-containing 1 [Brachionus plicatilis]|uniref:SAY domain-containing 1 n=1 Tax=Brachionus plicatilis TaxID=10195 RepID=A0A3M7RCZ3_BRAPC|nr:SAY domain-containing 1 [Brachionus plicatilis]